MTSRQDAFERAYHPDNPSGNSSSSHAPGSFYMGVTDAAMEAAKRLDAIHEAAEADARTGRSTTNRAASTREIREWLRPISDVSPKPTETIYDLSREDGSIPNFRDLAKGSSSQRSQDFQTGVRDEAGRQRPRIKDHYRNHSGQHRRR